MENNLQTFIAAATFAARKHRDQRRKGAEASPYINHPVAVANVLANWPFERKREYFQWSRAVVDQLRPASPRLAALFDGAYARKP